MKDSVAPLRNSKRVVFSTSIVLDSAAPPKVESVPSPAKLRAMTGTTVSLRTVAVPEPANPLALIEVALPLNSYRNVSSSGLNPTTSAPPPSVESEP